MNRVWLLWGMHLHPRWAFVANLSGAVGYNHLTPDSVPESQSSVLKTEINLLDFTNISLPLPSLFQISHPLLFK